MSGAAIQAARLAEAAARDAAEASAAARVAAAYARRLAVERDRLEGLDKKLRSGAVSRRGSEGRLRDRLPVNDDSGQTPSSGSWRPGFVRPVPLGKVWSFDCVAMWHNAIRMDLADLEEIISGLLGCRYVTLPELRAMFAWFSTFEAFAVTCLKAEEEVLFPWLEQWGRIEGDLSTANRITTKGSIIRGIRDTAACAALVGLDKDISGMVLINRDRNYYDGLKVGFAEAAPLASSESSTAVLYSTVLQKVADLVSSFTATMLSYFQEEENSLPVIIESLYDVEDMHAAGIERRMIRSIWKCGRKDESMVMLLRAVEHAPYSRAWMSRNLKRIERITVPLWKRRYGLGRGAVTSKFRERKVCWERATPSRENPSTPPSHNCDRPTQSSSPSLSTNIFYPPSHGISFNAMSPLESRHASAHGT